MKLADVSRALPAFVHTPTHLDADFIAHYEVARQVGIPNLTSFYSRFREWAGMTPQEWRERQR